MKTWKAVAVVLMVGMLAGCVYITERPNVTLDPKTQNMTTYERDVNECNHIVYATIPPMTTEKRMHELIRKCLEDRGYKLLPGQMEGSMWGDPAKQQDKK